MMHLTLSRLTGCCLASLLAAAPAFAQLSPTTAPAEASDVKQQLPPLEQAVQQSNWTDAAARIDAIVHDNPDALLSTESGTMVSFQAWLAAQPLAARQAIQPEYDKLNAEAAKQALEGVVTKAGNRPIDFVQAADAFPLTTAAGEAWGRAALRSLDFGDVSLVPSMLKRAADLGWKPSDAQKALLDSAANLKSFTAGGVPSNAPWYGQTPPAAGRKVIPVAAGGSVFIATERGLVATKETGELLWQYVAPKSDGASFTAKQGFHRVAVLCDPLGKPQVVVARQIVGGTRFGCLRAFRAADGKPLWSTETSATLGSYSLVSAPVVAAGQVIVMGVDDTVLPVPVTVFAFDTMTGHLIWQATIATFTNLTDGREAGSIREVDALWASSGVSVDGADAFLTCVGLAACIDRVDGKIRWERAYAPAMSLGDEMLAAYRRMNQGDAGSRETWKQKSAELKSMLGGMKLDPAPEPRDKRDHTPIEILTLAQYFSQMPRWTSTPVVAGDLLVLASADTASVVGLDRNTGLQQWEIPDDLRNASMVGVVGDAAIFAAGNLTAVDVHSTKVLWTWQAPGNEPIQGPTAISGRAIRVIAGKGTYAVSAETGKPDPFAGAGASIAPAMANEASRNALLNIDAVPSLMPPSNTKADEPGDKPNDKPNDTKPKKPKK